MEELETVVRGVTEAMGATYKLKYIHGYPTVRNDPAMTAYVQATAGRILGDEHVHPCKPALGGEDFAYVLEKIPGAMFFLGTRDPVGEPDPIPHHDSRFSPDEKAIPLGMKLMAHLVADFSKHHPTTSS
jgi:metal-dependent amidase/aminoacylase/carboxypeptidase family protein